MQAKPFIFTYTILNTYLICPHQMMRRYLKKDLPFKETPEMRFGNEAHTALEYRMGGKPLPAAMQHWEPLAAPIAALKPRAELQMGITPDGKPADFWAKENLFFRGKADVVKIEGTTAFIPDWKTGKPREDAFELETNAMLLWAANPYLVKIVGVYVWLKTGTIGQPHDVSNVAETWKKVNSITTEIKGCMQDNYWHKKRGPLCAWCNVFDCENNSNPEKPK